MASISEIEAMVLARAKMPKFTDLHTYFLSNHQDIPALIELAQSTKSHPVPAYSAWLLVHVANVKPQLLYKFQNQLEETLLHTTKHDIQRSLLVVLLSFPMRKKNEGALLDLYFNIFQNADVKVANRVYALYHLKRLRKKYPEIDPEVRAQIELIEELGQIKPALRIGIRNYLSA
ncbi:MAG: hypothetical protein ACKOBN_09905 [Flavobacteriales bacterium]